METLNVKSYSEKFKQVVFLKFKSKNNNEKIIISFEKKLNYLEVILKKFILKLRN